jgi:multidrug transporter EmrE-like cation transporter
MLLGTAIFLEITGTSYIKDTEGLQNGSQVKLVFSPFVSVIFYCLILLTFFLLVLFMLPGQLSVL